MIVWELRCRVCEVLIETCETRHELEEMPRACCADCLYPWALARANLPARATAQQMVAAARLLRLYQGLPPRQQDRLQRLLMLLHNDSPRAGRLLQRAVAGELGIEDLLARI